MGKEREITPEEVDAAVKEAEAVGLRPRFKFSDQAFRAFISAVLFAARDARSSPVPGGT